MNKEQALTATLTRSTEMLNEVVKERDALKAQRDLLYMELGYIVGISNGQVQRVATQAMAAVKGTS